MGLTVCRPDMEFRVLNTYVIGQHAFVFSEMLGISGECCGASSRVSPSLVRNDGKQGHWKRFGESAEENRPRGYRAEVRIVGVSGAKLKTVLSRFKTDDPLFFFASKNTWF